MDKENIWHVKTEEDLPLDGNFFTDRMQVIGDFLSRKLNVTRFLSSFNHKFGVDRRVKGPLFLKLKYKLVLLKSRVNYGLAHALRHMSRYIHAFKLLTHIFGMVVHLKLSFAPCPRRYCVQLAGFILNFLKGLGVSYLMAETYGTKSC